MTLASSFYFPPKRSSLSSSLKSTKNSNHLKSHLFSSRISSREDLIWSRIFVYRSWFLFKRGFNLCFLKRKAKQKQSQVRCFSGISSHLSPGHNLSRKFHFNSFTGLAGFHSRCYFSAAESNSFPRAPRLSASKYGARFCPR